MDRRLDPAKLARAFALLERAVAERAIPGAVAVVGCGDQTHGPHAWGLASILPAPRPMRSGTLFDLASLTKVVATAPAVLTLLDEGALRLDDPVTHFYPAFHSGVTLRHLLAHTAGLAAVAPLYKTARTPAEFVARIAESPLLAEPGTRVEYSCLGYIVLAHIVEKVSGQRLDALCRERIFAPLGMEATTFCPAPNRAEVCAATEVDPASGRPLCGVVHDENARGMGGVSGNAGLFSTADDLAIFCRMLLAQGRGNNAQILSPASSALSVRDHSNGQGRGLGWVLGGVGSHSFGGDLFSPHAFGHTGFTGTSLWIDPANDVFAVLLTNRVHPSRENHAHIRLRPLFHNGVAGALCP